MPDVNFQSWTATGTTLLAAGDELVSNISSLLNGNVDSAWTQEVSESTTESYAHSRGGAGTEDYPRLRKIFSRSFQGQTWYLELFNLAMEVEGPVDAVAGPAPLQIYHETQFLVWRLGNGLTGNSLSGTITPYKLIPVAWTTGDVAAPDQASDNSVAGGFRFLASIPADYATNHVYVNETAGSLLISLFTYHQNPDSEFEQPVLRANSQYIFIGELDQLYSGVAPLAYRCSSDIAFETPYNTAISNLGLPSTYEINADNFSARAYDLLGFTLSGLEFTLANTFAEAADNDPREFRALPRSPLLGSQIFTRPFTGSALIALQGVNLRQARVDGINFVPQMSVPELSQLGIPGRPYAVEYPAEGDPTKELLIIRSGTTPGAWRGLTDGIYGEPDFEQLVNTVYGNFNEPYAWGFGPYDI